MRGQGARGLLLGTLCLHQAPPLGPQRARRKRAFGDVNRGCPLPEPVSEHLLHSVRVSAHAASHWCPASRRMQRGTHQALALRFAGLVRNAFWVYSCEECSEVLCPNPFSHRPEKGSQAGPLWKEEPQASRV